MNRGDHFSSLDFGPVRFDRSGWTILSDTSAEGQCYGCREPLLLVKGDDGSAVIGVIPTPQGMVAAVCNRCAHQFATALRALEQGTE